MNKKKICKKSTSKNCTQLISTLFEICVVVIQEVHHYRTLEGVDERVIKSDTGGRGAVRKVNFSVRISIAQFFINCISFFPITIKTHHCQFY